MNISENIKSFQDELPKDITLVAISKTKPVDDLLEAYEAGQRHFGENKIQEMTEKWEKLPKDIKWHMVDSLKLLKEIHKEADKNGHCIDCLLQIKIAEEDSKFGISADEAKEILDSEEFKKLDHVKVKGLMGMATFTDDEAQVKKEFDHLKSVFKDFKEQYSDMEILSMGMSGDYKIAIDSGSNMVRIGSEIFGARD